MTYCGAKSRAEGGGRSVAVIVGSDCVPVGEGGIAVSVGESSIGIAEGATLKVGAGRALFWQAEKEIASKIRGISVGSFMCKSYLAQVQSSTATYTHRDPCKGCRFISILILTYPSSLKYNSDDLQGGLMEITWYGHSCFRLTERGLATVVTDPYDHAAIGYQPLNLRGVIVSVSHDAPGHNNINAVKTKPWIITGPGEYEIGNVFITAVQTNGGKRDKNEKKNILCVFDYSGVTIAHLGDIRQVPSQAQIEALGTVHVALVPVGDGGGLNAAKAAEVVSLLEPGIVIPMHYGTPDCKIKLDPLSKFLKEMGLSHIDPVDSLKITKSMIPEETRVVVLDYKQQDNSGT
jgi:L-ascorbate metabolism protein UlaG (beta-lactamase superfamily)